MIEPAETDLRPRKPPRIEPATETAVCRPAPRSWFSSRSTACCAVCSFCCSAATLASYFARSASAFESRPSRAPCASRARKSASDSPVCETSFCDGLRKSVTVCVW